MQLYLTRRNLNQIAGIDLAGITPLVEREVASARADDYDEVANDRLAAHQGRAYLVMIRGDRPVPVGHRSGLADRA